MLHVPKNGEEVTKKWLKTALDGDPSNKDNSEFEVISLEASGEQKGLLSTNFKAEVKRSADKEDGEGQKLALFIKTMPKVQQYVDWLNKKRQGTGFNFFSK